MTQNVSSVVRERHRRWGDKTLSKLIFIHNCYGKEERWMMMTKKGNVATVYVLVQWINGAIDDANLGLHWVESLEGFDFVMPESISPLEDDTSIDIEIKIPILIEFHRLIYNPDWHFECVTKQCKVLMDQFYNVSKAFLELNESYQKVSEDIAMKMGVGMAKFIRNEVETINNYDEYCHYAAGLVGIGLSKLFHASGKEISLPDPISNSMGLFLQCFFFILSIVVNLCSYGFAAVRGENDMQEQLDRGNTDLATAASTDLIPYAGNRSNHASYNRSKAAMNRSNGMSFHLLEQKLNVIEFTVGLVLDDTYVPQDLRHKDNSEKALECLNDMVANTLIHIEDCLKYMSDLRDPAIYRFCALPHIMAIGTLALCYNNIKVFTGVVKMRRGLMAKVIDRTKTMADVYGAFYDFSLLLESKIDTVRIWDRSCPKDMQGLGNHRQKGVLNSYR
nr:squalene synthase [Tanacetum cinerariifolium]